jgi:hypothetical protein
MNTLQNQITNVQAEKQSLNKRLEKFYFVGGPKTGQSEAFFRRLAQIGGSPPTWRIYPHVGNDGKALHIVDVESQEEILNHLHHFDGIYEWSEIVGIIETKR